MKKFVVLLAVCLFVFPIVVSAQEEEVEKDALEVTLYGGLGLPSGGIKDWNDSLGAKSRYEMGIDLGYFVTYSVVAGFSFTYTEFGIDNSPTDVAAEGLRHRLYNPNLYVKYYFPLESNFSPYVKGHLGLEYAKFTTFASNTSGDRYRQLSYDPALAYGIGGGLFYYTSDFGGVFIEANYHAASTKDTEVSYGGNTYKFGENLSVLDVHLGVRILIGSGS